MSGAARWDALSNEQQAAVLKAARVLSDDRRGVTGAAYRSNTERYAARCGKLTAALGELLALYGLDGQENAA